MLIQQLVYHKFNDLLLKQNKIVLAPIQTWNNKLNLNISIFSLKYTTYLERVNGWILVSESPLQLGSQHQ